MTPLSDLRPELLGNSKRIDLALLPPSSLIAGCVVFAVVDGAKRHGEFVADLQRQPSRLCKTNVMRMRRGAAADQAGLLGDKAQVLLRANALRLSNGEDTLIDFGARWPLVLGYRTSGRHPVLPKRSRGS